jgi:hypothetical protein
VVIEDHKICYKLNEKDVVFEHDFPYDEVMELYDIISNNTINFLYLDSRLSTSVC